MLLIKSIILLLSFSFLTACGLIQPQQNKAPDVVIVRAELVDLVTANGTPLNYRTTSAVVLPSGRTEIVFNWNESNDREDEATSSRLLFSSKPGVEYLITKTSAFPKPCVWAVDASGKFLDFQHPISCVN